MNIHAKVELQFQPGAAPDGEAESLRGELSAAAWAAGHLWLASDESNCIERLERDGDGAFGRHASLPLAGAMTLPGGEDEEIDIEGLDAADGHLWVLGSHSLKREKPESGKRKKRLRELETITSDGNRSLLARIPLRPGKDGATLGEGAARLSGGRRGNLLTDALRLDPHLDPFLQIPGKDNGLDIEGIAVLEGRVFVGLRGPVLRGWAVILELAIEDLGGGWLGLGPVGKGKAPYRKHFVDLRGLGVRDMCTHDGHILLLGGPTMDVDGPAAVFRWKAPKAKKRDTLTDADDLPAVIELPYGGQETEHPEGITVIGDAGPALLVVYDSPGGHRTRGAHGVRADLIALDQHA